MTLSPNLSPADSAALYRALMAPTATVTGNGVQPERSLRMDLIVENVDMVEYDMADALDALADGGEAL